MTALLFSLAHMVSQSIMWALLVFVPSLIFGYFYETRQTILAPIILHIFYNAVFFTALV
jgi:membrane protease YdiL (CAAX protease family)